MQCGLELGTYLAYLCSNDFQSTSLPGSKQAAFPDNMFDFINNLYKKNDHPLARESGMTVIIEELPADNPTLALEELTHWVRALSSTKDLNLKERVKRLARIDQSGHKYERALRREYTDTSRMHKVTEERIWNMAYEFLDATVQAHLDCIEPISQKTEQQCLDLAIVLMRTLRRLDLQAHWLHLRYRPLPYTLWNQIFSVIKLAEERDVLNLPITLNSTAKIQTTVAQELLKLLMMSVAAPEHLTKTQIDLARLLTHNLASCFCWEQIPDNSTVFHVDFTKPKTPLRLTKVAERHFMSRCFGSGEAVRALVVGFKQLEHGSIPSALGVLDFAFYKRADLLEVMAHLSQCWCKMDARTEHQHFDKRHAKRTQVFYRINVVPSFNLLYDQLVLSTLPAPAANASPARSESLAYQEQVDMQIYGFITERTRKKIQSTQALLAVPTKAAQPLTAAADQAESWVVENISQMGYGVNIARLKEDWVRGNMVIGIQPDHAPWQLCVIRRLASETIENNQAGIQILSNRPCAAMLCPADSELSVWETAADTQTYHHTPGILMHLEPPYQNEESLLLVSNSYQLHHTYTMAVGDAKRTIRLMDRIHAFSGVDQVIFTEVSQANARH